MFDHPWRKELYIFGKKLINEFEKMESELDIKVTALRIKL